MKKYELTNETINHYGITLYRIHVLKDFSNVKKGDLGGYVESEKNLSQDGNAMVFGNALVFGNARVYDNAQIFGNAIVYSNARVYDNAQIFGNAMVYSDAKVSGNAMVFGNALVFGNAMVYSDARVYGNTRVYGDAKVSGNARVYGDAIIRSYDEINNSNQIIYISGFKYPITITYCSIHIGCMDFTLDQLSEEIERNDTGKDEIERMKLVIEIVLDEILSKFDN